MTLYYGANIFILILICKKAIIMGIIKLKGSQFSICILIKYIYKHILRLPIYGSSSYRDRWVYILIYLLGNHYNLCI